MYEPKSRFAKRIGKPIAFVSEYARRGILPVNERGYVCVEKALAALKNRRPAHRPRLPRSERIVKVRVCVRQRQARVIIEMAKELRGG